MYEMPLFLDITEVSFYQILTQNSNNDIRNGIYYDIILDHKIK